MQKGSENMNRIFKVIWSKTKNCYVVASELAKGRTKASSTGDKTKRLALAAITALMLLPVGGFSYAADTTKVEPASGTSTAPVEVYTKAGADDTFVKKGSTNGQSLTIGASESEILSTHQYVTGAQTTYDGQNGQVVTQATGGKSSISLKVGNSEDLTYNFTNYSEVTTTKDGGTTFTYHYEGGAQTIDDKTTIKGNTVTTGRVTASNGVVDGTTTEGVSVKKTNTVGQNLSALDDRITAVKDYVLNETGKNYVSKTDAAVQDGAVVKANNKVGQNVQALDTALAKETAARIGADKAQDAVIQQVNQNAANGIATLATAYNNEVASREAADNELNERITNEANEIHKKTNQLQSDLATETADRKTADNELNERITNEANAIHETTNQLQNDLNTETAAREAGDTALDTRITNVKEYLEKQTSDKYVSKDDAAVQDGAIVKAANTIGDNVTKLDAALASETAARIGADKAQDKVIQQVNQNMVDGFNTINKNMADGFTALNQADANEAAARVAADTKLVEAVNSGLSLSNDNVLQKNTTTIDAQGNVTTSKTDANEMILNKGKDNQITLNEKGIKVGTNSSVMDKDGVYTGGDTFDAAKAAMSSDGQIKGANGKFTVDASGNTTVTSLDAGTGTIQTKGDLYAKDATFSGDITAKDATLSGDLSAKDGTFSGDLSAKDGTFSGDVSAKDVTATGTLQGAEVTDGTATMKNGNITGVKNLSAETITTSGDATIGGDLTVKGKLNVDEIDLTKNGIVGDNNVTASTKVAAGEITGYKKATSTKDGSEKESAIDYDENGTSTWAKATDADGKWNKSTLTVEGSDVTSKVVDSKENNNLSTQTSTQSQSTLKDKDSNTNTATQSATESSSTLKDKDGKTSTFKQRVGEILNQINSSDTVFSKVDQKVDNITSEVKNGDNATSTTQSATDITNTAKQGTITNEAQKLVNKASDTISNEAANNITNTSTNGNIANTATNGTISNNAKELTNTASDSITNTAENGNISNIASNGTISNEAKTISNKAVEAMTNDAKTITNTASESVTTQIGDGSTVQSVMNESGIANKATGKSITNDAATITNTGTTSVTNQVGNNKVLVDTTHVQSAFGDTIYTTWDESGITNNATDKTVTTNAKDILNTATGDITNSATNGTITNTAKDLVNTASENMTNNVGKDLTTKVGGKQTTTVTGDSSLTAENINNTAKNKITNKAIDVETDASSSIVNKVSNDAGSNTSTQLSYETKEEMSQADGKTASYLRGAAEEKSQLTDGDKKTTIDTVAGQTNTNITEGKNISNSLQKADQVASSVTDGTNTTVVNQDAGSLASSITDGTKVNNSSNTVDKSEQLIKASDTQYSATIKTATKTEDALISGNNIIDVIKGLDNAGNPTISSAVTDGTNSTGVTQTAKDITNTAKNGTIANDAKDITNNAAENMTNTVGKDLSTTVGGNQTTTVTGDSSLTAENITNKATKKLSNAAAEIENSASTSITDKVGDNVRRTMTTKTISESVKDGTKSNSFSKNAEKDINIITDGTNTSTLSQLADSVNTSLKNGTQSLNNKKTVTEDVTKMTDKNTGAFSSSSQKADAMTNTVKNGSKSNTVTETASTSEQKLVSGNILDILKDAENGYVNTTVSNSDGSSSTGVKQTYTDITSTAKQGTITNDAKNLVNKAEEKLSNSAAEIENTATTSIKDTVGKSTVTTTTDGTTFENTDHNMAIGDGSITKTTISGNTLETGKATMDYAEVMKDLTVGGTTTTKDLHVTNNATIDGTLDVTGAANFQDTVTVAKDLRVGGNASVSGSVTASSYKVGDKTYIDADGINANNQKVVNVAPGRIAADSKDAINGSQLYQTNERVTSVENRVGTVENRVDKLDSRVNKVGANAAALANLHPLEFDADSKWNIAAAVGGYKGETATAIGAFYRPNENVMVNVSSSFGTGENMYGGGISLRIGQGGNKARRNATNGLTEREKAMQKQIDSLTSRLDALLSVINPNMSKDFPDVPENHWAYEAVSRLAGNGVIQGYEDGKYHGDRTMTRYEMAEIIYNALSKGAKAEKKLVEEFKPELQAMAAQKKA